MVKRSAVCADALWSMVSVRAQFVTVRVSYFSLRHSIWKPTLLPLWRPTRDKLDRNQAFVVKQLRS
jgi:hypothetical protein